MMRFAILALALSASPAAAMVSGFYDSANKIAAILASPELADVVGQAPIGAITETGTDKDGAALWSVRTQECDVVVKVIGQPPADGMVGMTTYTTQIVQGCD